MPMCTYINEFQAANYRAVADSEMDDLLQELRRRTGRDWLIREDTIVTDGGVLWWSDIREEISYTLYNHVHSIEYQHMNIGNSREAIMAYLYGYLGALDEVGNLLEQPQSKLHSILDALSGRNQ